MGTDAATPLRHRMTEDMNARKLSAGTQRGHIGSCKRFAAFLNRSPDTATTEDIRRFQLHLAEAGVSICNRNHSGMTSTAPPAAGQLRFRRPERFSGDSSGRSPGTS
jgi:Phage integrase, N-terminal SAM-like domain